jgi:hypothetical protein
MRVERYGNLSTAHLTREVADQLDEIVAERAAMLKVSNWDIETDWQAWMIVNNHDEYGWWLWVPEREPDLWAMLPECLRACLDLAIENRVIWLQFDRDEAPTEELPYYEW